MDALQNRGPLRDSLRWNAGVYLWFAGLSDSLETALKTAATVMDDGKALHQLDQLCSCLSIR
jgi:Anthranilate phosphoribosyltransferase